MSHFKTGMAMLAPSIIRAFTFYLDRQWGAVVQTIMSSVSPVPSSLIGVIIITALFSVSLSMLEKYLNGDLQSFHLRQQTSNSTSASDSNKNGVDRNASDFF